MENNTSHIAVNLNQSHPYEFYVSRRNWQASYIILLYYISIRILCLQKELAGILYHITILHIHTNFMSPEGIGRHPISYYYITYPYEFYVSRRNWQASYIILLYYISISRRNWQASYIILLYYISIRILCLQKELAGILYHITILHIHTNFMSPEGIGRHPISYYYITYPYEFYVSRRNWQASYIILLYYISIRYKLQY